MASIPRALMIVSSFREGPLGFFSPRSHSLTRGYSSRGLHLTLAEPMDDGIQAKGPLRRSAVLGAQRPRGLVAGPQARLARGVKSGLGRGRPDRRSRRWIAGRQGTTYDGEDVRQAMIQLWRKRMDSLDPNRAVEQRMGSRSVPSAFIALTLPRSVPLCPPASAQCSRGACRTATASAPRIAKPARDGRTTTGRSA
jgi:hypothetical protein